MWQMTLDELTTEAFEPNGQYNRLTGLMTWICPLCGQPVGIHSDGSIHEEGWLYKREECKNGHKIKR